MGKPINDGLTKHQRYRLRHREELNRKSRNRYYANVEQARERGRKYDQKRAGDPQRITYMSAYRAEKRPARHWNLKKLYGLDEATFLKIKADQGGVCKICGGVNSDGKELNVDHCHTTGRIRGLLCRTCNQVLGHLKDNPETFRKAAVYLESHELDWLDETG